MRVPILDFTRNGNMTLSSLNSANQYVATDKFCNVTALTLALSNSSRTVIHYSLGI